jgi:hypothetical protein
MVHFVINPVDCRGNTVLTSTVENNEVVAVAVTILRSSDSDYNVELIVHPVYDTFIALAVEVRVHESPRAAVAILRSSLHPFTHIVPMYVPVVYFFRSYSVIETVST